MVVAAGQDLVLDHEHSGIVSAPLNLERQFRECAYVHT